MNKVVFSPMQGVNSVGTLPGISLLLNLPEWGYGYISQYSFATKIYCLSSGEQFSVSSETLIEKSPPGFIRQGDNTEMHACIDERVDIFRI
jgi:hypothetical protein